MYYLYNDIIALFKSFCILKILQFHFEIKIKILWINSDFMLNKCRITKLFDVGGDIAFLYAQILHK